MSASPVMTRFLSMAPGMRLLVLALPVAFFWLMSALPDEPAYAPVLDTQTREEVLSSLLIGTGEAVSGDEILVGNRLVRLWGIDAFEASQTCMQNGARVDHCGAVPKGILADQLAQHPVACTVRGTDKWGRVIAQCQSNGVDLAAMVVHAGYALTTPDHKRPYADAEDGAKQARAGAWSGFFMQPWYVRDANAPI